jgi:alanyl-tRNA synthetase
MPPNSQLPTPDSIRRDFVAFWKARASHVQASSSLIPYNDPTVLLTTAGMQQFVPYFLGRERSPRPRYVSVQKCFRTSDIDEVGDRSHLTFFEMLGNFSVGDYFKAEVIPWALEFSVQHMGLEQDRLWITIHDSDDEARDIWLRAGIPQERIQKFGDEHNWWGPPGKSGPCGPNSELYYEQGPGFGCGYPEDPPDCDCGRLEFWNLVFIQYNQDEARVRTLLPEKHVDTGMGLERAAVVASGLHTIYDTDLFRPLLEAAEEISGTRYGTDAATDYALRVLADHSRGMTFLVLDGVVPGNVDRGYVLRRVIRRAVRYGRRLGIDRPFLSAMAEAVIRQMAPHYPELDTDRTRIQQVIANEEELFGRTLRAGLVQIERLVAQARTAGVTQISGAQVFDLYQTYGFPVELTEEALKDEGLTFDRTEFESALAAEQERARSAARFHTVEPGAATEFGEIPPTEFLAWTDTSSEARVLAARTDAGPLAELTPGVTARLVLDASAFYPEGGGQVGDAGVIRTPGGTFVVEDARFDSAGHIVHIGRLQEGALRVGELARGEVDVERRDRSRRHHTATHLLHRALKDVLGDGTSQQGSYVGPDQLRFDFNHPRAMHRDELQAVSSIINDRGMDDLPVHWEIVPLARARQMGAVMMFGEKYGEDVRVVSIGEYSRELCGGTHTHHSGELGSVLIASESGIGSGKRRIFAYAGHAAMTYLNDRLRLLDSIAERVGARSADDVAGRVDSLLAEIETLRRELDRRQKQQANASAGHLAAHAREVNGVKVVAQSVENAQTEDLKTLVDAVRQELRSGVVVVGSAQNGRAGLVVGVTPDLVGRVKANDLIKGVANAAGGGGGGGGPEFATGSGKDAARLGAALEHAYTLVAQALAA